MNNTIIQKFVVGKFKSDYIKLLALLIISIGLLVIWPYVEHLNIYRFISHALAGLGGLLAEGIGCLTGKSLVYQGKYEVLNFGNEQMKILMPVNSYSYYTILLLFYLLVPSKKWQGVFFQIIFTAIFISFRAAVIAFIKLPLAGTVHSILLSWLEPLIYFPMLVNVMFVVKNNKLLLTAYLYLTELFRNKINVSLAGIVLLLIVIPPLPRVIFYYIDIRILDEITSFILNGAMWLLGVFNYHAVVSDKFILLGRYWLSLEQPCLGLGVATIVILLILITKSKLKNKLIFVPFFLLFFSFMNSVRLAFTLVYIKNTYEISGLDKPMIHNTITYFMYLVAFGLFLLYYFWFQDIDFSCKKMK
ncbi:MAG: hypothetical protein PHH37_12775 [Paludibacter sp.]|nr:hypothetical protein [Paludibacter sp.]